MDRRDFLQLSALAAAGLWAQPSFGLQADREQLERRGPAKKILILGAGLAGLVAGYQLADAGHEVTILEAQMIPGGRVRTLREPFSDGLYAEAGAGRIPETHHITLQWVKMFGLQLDAFYPTTLADIEYQRGKRIRAPRGRDIDMAQVPLNLTPEERRLGFQGMKEKYFLPLLRKVWSVPPEQWPSAEVLPYGEMRLDEYLRRQGASPDAVRYFTFGFAHDSVLDFLRDAASHEVNKMFKIRGGNDLLPRAIAGELSENIRYGAEVVRVEHDDKGVRAVFRQMGVNHTLAADAMIITLPFTVLRRLELAPRFSADKQRAIDELPYFSVSRVYLQTRTRFWEADGLNGFATTDHPMEIWSPAYGEESPRGILMGYMYEDLARRVAAMHPGERVTFGVEEMSKVFPGLREHLETGTSWCWDEHPWSRGALCLFTPGQFAYFPHIVKPEGRVHFAGEHTSPWPGWMQGAIYSGLRAAREVNEQVRS
ncbi:MAG: FAD-dependent oxidoreductase [Acidobacteria bacterium]|nr:FAD-dependent oxidoreductase [Acidobacteriota bacterium]